MTATGGTSESLVHEYTKEWETRRHSDSIEHLSSLYNGDDNDIRNTVQGWMETVQSTVIALLGGGKNASVHAANSEKQMVYDAVCDIVYVFGVVYHTVHGVDI
eukprot:GHVO01038753.1.p2 GENE.GHVO01038753.1~~GHVO01038753.1.p2  ORF type:complete len:103 (+),score=27.79 GHVO01038753.1:50-358(+)